ncbi:unnamed protein product [Closterium sp. Naga37s-1]|nr:unnamed protein product [Closterium sp. Naga37s-1]
MQPPRPKLRTVSHIPLVAWPHPSRRLATSLSSPRHIPLVASPDPSRRLATSLSSPRRSIPSVAASLTSPHPFRRRIPSVAASLPSPHPFRRRIPSVTASLPSPHPFRRRILSVAASLPSSHPFITTTLSSLPLSRCSIPPLSDLCRLPPPRLPPSFPSDNTSSTSTFFLPVALISLAGRPAFPYPRPSLPLSSSSASHTRPLRRPRFASPSPLASNSIAFPVLLASPARLPCFPCPSSLFPLPVFLASPARLPCFPCPSSFCPLPVALLSPTPNFPPHSPTFLPRGPDLPRCLSPLTSLHLLISPPQSPHLPAPLS